MTNGEKIKEIFPNIDTSIVGDYDVIDVYNLGMYCQTFDVDWWNAEYQEPSGSEKPNLSEIPTSSDCVDRHSVDLLAYRYLKEPTDNHVAFYEDFLDLPSVTPQEPKTGHWIEVAKYSDGKHEIECSKCGSHIFDRGHANSYIVKEKYKYCPRCGAKMVEPQESEG